MHSDSSPRACTRWPRLLAAWAAATALAAASPGAHAEVRYSGVLNATIPPDTIGLYVNVVKGELYAGPHSYPATFDPAYAFDFNVYRDPGWSLLTSNQTGQPKIVPASARGFVVDAAGSLNLAEGELIGPGRSFTVLPIADVPAGQTSLLVGFRFRNEGALMFDSDDDTVHYGWFRVLLPANGPGTLVDYAYETTPDTALLAGVGAVPEPGSLALMASGLAGLMLWRRRAGAATGTAAFTG